MSLIMDILQKTKQKQEETEGFLEDIPVLKSEPPRAPLPEPVSEKIQEPPAKKRHFSHPSYSEAAEIRPEPDSSHLFQPKKTDLNWVSLSIIAGACLLFAAAIFLVFYLAFFNVDKKSAVAAPAPKPTVKTASVSAAPAPAAGQPAPASVKSGSSLPVLEGLILGSGEPLAIIEGKILKVGDQWNEKTVKFINVEGVVLAEENGNSVFLKNTKQVE